MVAAESPGIIAIRRIPFVAAEVLEDHLVIVLGARLDLDVTGAVDGFDGNVCSKECLGEGDGYL